MRDADCCNAPHYARGMCAQCYRKWYAKTHDLTAYHRRYAAKNRERMRKRARLWYAKNAEHRRAYNRKNYSENRDKARRHCHEYYMANRERLLAKAKLRYAATSRA